MNARIGSGGIKTCAAGGKMTITTAWGRARGAVPTAWVPRSKPFWFTEYGCAAIDRGTNQPNVFLDPKSSESALPYFSRGGAMTRSRCNIFRGHAPPLVRSGAKPCIGTLWRANGGPVPRPCLGVGRAALSVVSRQPQDLWSRWRELGARPLDDGPRHGRCRWTALIAEICARGRGAGCGCVAGAWGGARLCRGLDRQRRARCCKT
jgi:hypothetical protein